MFNCLILGSGRSGTSTIAGTLAKSGYYMGDNLIPPRDANPKGFFECADINLHSNEEIMRAVTPHMRDGTRWLAEIPTNVTFDNPPPKAIGVIRRMVSKEPFCYKDPRFSYTLPAWRPYLRNTRFVCVFRNPASTAKSIVKECQTAKYLRGMPMDYAGALRVWVCTYECIMNKHRLTGEWLFINYTDMFETAASGRLGAFLEAPVDKSFPTPALYRSKPEDTIIVPDKAKFLYDQLCALA